MLRKQSNIPFSEENIGKYLFCILNGIQVYHHSNVFHGDISLSSIIINNKNNRCALDYNISGIKGRELFKAPELYGRGVEYALSSDIWSLGVLLYYMCALAPPFFSVFELLKWYYSDDENVDLSFLNERYSKELLTIISQCLSKNPNNRPNINELLCSQYIICLLEKSII